MENTNDKGFKRNQYAKYMINWILEKAIKTGINQTTVDKQM